MTQSKPLIDRDVLRRAAESGKGGVLYDAFDELADKAFEIEARIHAEQGPHEARVALNQIADLLIDAKIDLELEIRLHAERLAKERAGMGDL